MVMAHGSWDSHNEQCRSGESARRQLAAVSASDCEAAITVGRFPGMTDREELNAYY
jgi:hypothetical protein